MRQFGWKNKREARVNLGAALLLLLVLAGCAHWRDRFLAEGLNRLTEDAVTKRMGPPHFTRKLDAGGEVWTYQYRFSSLHGTGRHLSGHSYCIEYLLIFDEKRILREWQTQGC